MLIIEETEYRVHGHSALSLHFSINLKLLFKIKLIFKILNK